MKALAGTTLCTVFPACFKFRFSVFVKAMVYNVESLLEETLPLLRRAQELKLLEHHEIQTIVKKRRDHEYLIRRRDATRQNFFRYAIFEKDVARLIQRRSRKRGTPLSEARPLIGQFRLQRARIYNRAVYRFPGDDKLWIHMAKDAIDEGAFKRASRIFAQAVSKCGGCPQIWLAAIGFHFDKCSDPRTARVLAQRALRALSANVSVWMEYFRMELYYLSKLTARRFTIGFDARDAAKDTSTENKKESEERVSDAPQGNNLNLGNVGFWEGGVPLAVIKGALSKTSLTDFHRAEFYKIASDCPLVPASVLIKLVDIFQTAFPSCVAVKCMKIGVVWDVAKADMNRNNARKQNGVVSGKTEKLEGFSTECPSERHSNDEQVALDLEDLIKQNIAELSNSHSREAVLLLLTGFEETISKMKFENADKVNQTLTRATKMIKKMDPNSSVVQDTVSKDRAWTLRTLKSYFQCGGDELDVSYEGVYNAVKKECLVPFRSSEQDDILCRYFAWDVDLSRVLTLCDEMLPMPPVSMACLFAASQAILRLMSDAEKVTPERRATLVALVRRLFRKASQLPDAKSNVSFWIVYIDFERRVVQNASEASTVNTKAMRTLDELYHDNFLEELAILTLT